MISRIRRLQRCSENASSKRRRAISHRWARMSKAIALSMFWQLQPCATPQRPCKIACSPSIADFGVQTLQGIDAQECMSLIQRKSHFFLSLGFSSKLMNSEISNLSPPEGPTCPWPCPEPEPEPCPFPEPLPLPEPSP